jgi:hypothetical protein
MKEDRDLVEIKPASEEIGRPPENMPAPIPSYRDRAAFWRDSYARSSFVHAAAFVSAMFRELYSVERDAFTIAITAAYCRPFKQRKSVRLSEDLVPAEHKETHDTLIEMRDKVIAHRDLVGPNAEWGFVSDLHVSVKSRQMELNTISPKITDELAQKVLALTGHLISVLDERINAFVGHNLGRVFRNDGTYVVSLDDDPAEWLIKKKARETMRLVPQLSRFTCPLACLEAHCADNGLPHTQESLLRDFPAECNVGVKIGGEDAGGALTVQQFIILCRAAGIPVDGMRDFRPEVILDRLNSLGPNQSAILFVVRYKGNNETHYVRFDHVDASETVHFMCPYFGGAMPDKMTLQEFGDWDTTVLFVG